MLHIYNNLKFPFDDCFHFLRQLQINYHRLGNFKQQTLILSQLKKSEVKMLIEPRSISIVCGFQCSSLV